jgi:hypothetical protein
MLHAASRVNGMLPESMLRLAHFHHITIASIEILINLFGFSKNSTWVHFILHLVTIYPDLHSFPRASSAFSSLHVAFYCLPDNSHAMTFLGWVARSEDAWDASEREEEREELSCGIWKETRTRELYSATATAAHYWDGPHVEDIEMRKDDVLAAFAINLSGSDNASRFSIRGMTNNFWPSLRIFVPFSLGCIRPRVQLKSDCPRHSCVSAASPCRSSWCQSLQLRPVSALHYSLST